VKTIFKSKFDKQFKRAPQNIQNAVSVRLKLFASNPDHPLLRNHKLSGKYQGCRSINMTGDWRAIFEEVDPILDDPYIEFIALGTHSQLYK